PDAVVLDADILSVAIDADLTIVMNVAAMHASAGTDADPSSAIQLHQAIFDSPSRSLMSVNRAFLRGTSISLDSDITDEHIGGGARERKHGRGHLDLMVRRIIDYVDPACMIVDIELIAGQRILARNLRQRLIVHEQCVRTIAGGSAGQAFAMFRGA